jgi:hypothetical protein
VHYAEFIHKRKQHDLPILLAYEDITANRPGCIAALDGNHRLRRSSGSANGNRHAQTHRRSTTSANGNRRSTSPANDNPHARAHRRYTT